MRIGPGTLLPILKLAGRRLAGTKSPFQMTLSLTNRCNFRCDYCHIPLQVRPELETGEWLRVIDALSSAGMGRASLIGGEPLVRQDAGAIVAHLKRRGIHASMNTNGWLVADRLDELAPLDLVCLTLDGREGLHDRQRHAGSYVRVLRAIEALRSRGIAVVTMTVVTAAGVDEAELDHVLAVARAHGIRAFFQLEHDAEMDVHRPVGARLDEARIARFARHLLGRKRAGAPVGNSSSALEAQADRRLLLDCRSCQAGHYFGYVFSDGTVSHCLLTGAQGHSTYRGEGVVEAFRRLSPAEGPGCSCVPYYEVNRMLALDPAVLRSALDLVRG